MTAFDPMNPATWNSAAQPQKRQRQPKALKTLVAALDALAHQASNPLVRAALEDGVERLRNVVRVPTAPEDMRILADYLDNEATVLATVMNTAAVTRIASAI